MDPPPMPGITAFGISDNAVHAFAATLQGVIAQGWAQAPPFSPHTTTTGIVVALLLPHLQFLWEVESGGYLVPTS